MVMKKNHSEEFKALWTSNRLNRFPLLSTILARVILATGFIFYVCNYLTRFTDELLISIAVALLALMVLSRSLKRRSIRLERLFIQNLRSRDIEAQVLGRKRPLYEGRLLDRNVHIADFDLPEDSRWAGNTLCQLELRQRFGVMVSSILRGHQRINIPDGGSIVFPGDKLQVIGTDDQLASFGQAIASELQPEDTDIEKREMRLSHIVISGSSELVDKTISESGIRDRFGCMAVGLEEGHEHLSQIDPARKFQRGDVLWVVGEEEDLKRLAQVQ